MIRCQLKMALDFAKPKKGEVVPHEKFSYRNGDRWQVCNRGPGYCNIYDVLEFDDEGLALLRKSERKEQSTTSKESPE